MTSGSALYLDTSCLLKLFFPEPEAARVIELLGNESDVVVSELALLEAETQLGARLLGGLLTKSRHQKLARELLHTMTLAPFRVAELAPDALARARSLAARTRVHCRTLDLLHLAAMDAERIERLLTNDAGQAAAAKALGFTVTIPR